MTQRGIVKRVLDGEMAEVAIERSTACGHDCSNCASGCTTAYTAPLMLEAENHLGAQEGDRVVVGSSTKKLLLIAAVVYAVPVLMFVIGAVASSALELAAGGASALSVGLFALGVVFGVIYNRRFKRKGNITHKILEILK